MRKVLGILTLSGLALLVAARAPATPALPATAQAANSADGGALCSLNLDGAVRAAVACVVEQGYERPPVDAGHRYLAIRESPIKAGRRIVLLLHVSGKPRLGVQPPTVVDAVAQVQESGATWQAIARSTGSLGSLVLTLTTVRSVRRAGAEVYELHGIVEAQLLPTVEGDATGVIDLRAAF